MVYFASFRTNTNISSPSSVKDLAINLSLYHHLVMLILLWTTTVKVQSINWKWFNARLQSSSPTDSETHVVLVKCCNA